MFTLGPWTIKHDGTITGLNMKGPGSMVVARDVCVDDARLIAAAPEMYRLLVEWLSVFDSVDDDDDKDEASLTIDEDEVRRVIGQINGDRL